MRCFTDCVQDEPADLVLSDKMPRKVDFEVKTLVVCSSFCGSFVIHFCNNLEEMNLTGSFSHQNFS